MTGVNELSFSGRLRRLSDSLTGSAVPWFVVTFRETVRVAKYLGELLPESDAEDFPHDSPATSALKDDSCLLQHVSYDDILFLRLPLHAWVFRLFFNIMSLHCAVGNPKGHFSPFSGNF